MGNRKKGRQKPTRSFVLPYRKSKGQEAIALYRRTGKQPLEWQELQIKAMMAVDKNGIWIHTKLGLAVPRRNGKNEVIVMREMYALEHGEHASHTVYWAEWSVPELSDVHDRRLWYETNPSLGSILTERKIADEITENN